MSHTPRDFSPRSVHAPALQSREWPTPRTRQQQPGALVIVAKYPEPGAVKTRLGAAIGDARAAMLYRAFLGDLSARFGAAQLAGDYQLHWAVASGTHPVEALHEVVGAQARIFAQCGADFAVRLYNIAVEMQAAGYRRVAIMSSDAPHLPIRLITDAFAALDGAEVALAPAEDGGYSLIALHLAAEGDTTPPDLFRGIRMSTATVLAETLQRAASLGLSTTLLPISFDVDEAGDLTRLWAALADDPALAPQTWAALGGLLPAVMAHSDGGAMGGREGRPTAMGGVASS